MTDAEPTTQAMLVSTLEMLAERVGRLQEKVTLLERRLVTESKETVTTRFNQGQLLMLEALRDDDETVDDVRQRVAAAQVIDQHSPLGVAQAALRLLLGELGGYCAQLGLHCWPELGTLRGLVRRRDFEVSADRGSMGMPLVDISTLAEELESSRDLELSVLDVPNANGPIRIYRLSFRSLPQPFVDIFAYHYATVACAESPTALWKRLGQLRQAYAAEGQSVPNDDPDSLTGLIDDYIGKQDQLLHSSEGEDWLVWGIENFRYGATNVLDVKRMFPLDKTIFGDIDLPVPRDMAWYERLRRVDARGLPATPPSAAFDKMPPSELDQLVEALSG